MIDFGTFAKTAHECGDFDKLIAAKGFKNLRKVQ